MLEVARSVVLEERSRAPVVRTRGAAILSAAVLLSASRSAWLGVLVGLLMLVYLRHLKVKALAKPALMASLILAVVYVSEYLIVTFAEINAGNNLVVAHLSLRGIDADLANNADLTSNYALRAFLLTVESTAHHFRQKSG